MQLLKKIMIFMILITMAFSCTLTDGTDDDGGDDTDDAKKGTLNISIIKDDYQAASYRVTLTSPNGFVETKAGTQTTFSFKVEYGTYYITASALDAGDLLLSQVKSSKLVGNELEAADISFVKDITAVPAPVISCLTTACTTESDFRITTTLSGADIYYTTDGAVPTAESEKYTGLFKLPEGTITVKAFAVKTGYTDSTVTTAVFTVTNPDVTKVTTPVITPSNQSPYLDTTTFEISCTTVGATVRYTTDGSAVTESSTVFGGAFSLAVGSKTIRAKAYKTGMTVSDEVTKTFEIVTSKLPAPVISISGSSPYTTKSEITVTSSVSGGYIYYTIDGSDPTTSSTLYSSPFTLSAGTKTVKAKVFKSGYTGSDAASATYTITEDTPTGITIYVSKSFADQMYAWITGTTEVYPLGGWSGRSITKADTVTNGGVTTTISSIGDYYTVFFKDQTNVNYILLKNSVKVTGDLNATVDKTVKSDGSIVNGKPEDIVPTKPVITISPAAGQYTGTTSISITIKNGNLTLLSSSATFNGKTISVSEGTTTVTLSSYVDNEASGTLSVSASNSLGSTSASASFTRKDESVFTGDDIDNLRIFQVMVCSFQDGDPNIGYSSQWNSGEMAGGDLQGIINSLDYIKGLGMNTLWMTPVFYSDPNSNQAHTGYYANDFFNVDPKFGGNDKLKELIQKAHEKNLYVVLDTTMGHNAGSVQQGGSSSISASPLSGKIPNGSNPVNYNDGGNSLQYYKDVAYYWIKNYKIDGWRLDQSYQLGPGDGGDHKGQGGSNFYWDDIRASVEAAVAENKADASNPTVGGKKWGILGYMVGEDWEAESGIAQNTYGTSVQGVHSAFDFPLRYKIVQAIAREEWGTEVSSNRAQAINSGFATHSSYPSWAHPNLMLGNHDLARLGDLINYSVSHKNNYWKRHKLAISLLGAYSGPITLYYGEEWGQAKGSSDLTTMHIGRTTGKVSGFNSDQQDLINYVTKVMTLRSAHSSMWQEKTRTNLIASGDKYADLKYDSSTGDKVLYCVNLGTSSQTIELSQGTVGGSFLDDGIDDEDVSASSSKYTITLDPLEAKFFIVK